MVAVAFSLWVWILGPVLLATKSEIPLLKTFKTFKKPKSLKESLKSVKTFFLKKTYVFPAMLLVKSSKLQDHRQQKLCDRNMTGISVAEAYDAC